MTCKTAWEIESSFGEPQAGPYGPARVGPNTVIPDTHETECLTMVDQPEMADHSLPTIDKFVGFNPYDTAVLQTKVLPIK